MAENKMAQVAEMCYTETWEDEFILIELLTGEAEIVEDEDNG
jgi:hypothetical protein